jgi:putative ABC transport system permease protein
VAKYYGDVTQRLQQLPGVQSAAVIGAGLPLEGGGNLPVEIPGKPWHSCDFRMVTPEYFRTIGIPVKLGRVFEPSDNQHGAAVAVVSESFARLLFPNENVLGKRLKAEQSDSLREIVGVVGDVKSYLDQPAEPTVFIPIAQSPYGIAKIFEGWFATSVVLRTAIDPAQVSRSLQVQLHAIDPSVATGDIRTMQQVRSAAVATRQFNMALLGVFAGLAALLAAGGIYGVIAYNLKQKTHEIGVRMALGAQRRHVLGMIYREAVYLAATGIGLGSVGALALARLIQGYLYGVKPTDPAAFVGSAVLLGGVAMLACGIPALRATRVDPLVALRYE